MIIVIRTSLEGIKGEREKMRMRPGREKINMKEGSDRGRGDSFQWDRYPLFTNDCIIYVH